jgi:hypothetical protein
MEKENAFAALLFGLLGGLIIIFALNEPKNVVVSKEKFVSTIDSVWCTSPGQESTLQTDYRYYGKASNGQVIISTDKANGTFNMNLSVAGSCEERRKRL